MSNIILHKLNHTIEKDIYDKIYKKKLFKKIGKKYKKELLKLYPTVSIKVIRSIRSEYTKNLIVKQHHKIKNMINTITNKYDSNNILSLSKIYNFPPVMLLKMIFLNKGFSKNNVNDIFIEPNKNILNLSNADIEQIHIAIKNDAFSLIDTNKQLEQSLLFEKKIEKILKKNHLVYKTQDDLSKEQMKVYGRAISTPDFLLKSDLYINNVKINWIDAKNYYLACTNFSIHKIKKQIDKYIKLYGTGAIICKLGACESLQFNNTIIIPYTDFIVVEGSTY
jgi:hypothetical protein